MSAETGLAPPRAALFVPATRPERVVKAFAAGADAVIVDLEDAVAEADKDATREALRAAAPLAAPDRPTALLRINSPLGDAGRADVEAAAAFAPDGLVVPKADAAAIAVAAAAGLPLVALVETAAGVLAAAEVAALPEVALLLLGSVDLAAELGVELSHGSDELGAARGQLVLAAAAAGLPGPLDGPCLAPGDRDALESEIYRARRLGFAGKCCIHPNQVEAVTAGFSPSAEEVEWARRVVAASKAVAGGVAVLDGRMVDRPVVLRARQILSNDERNR